MQDCLKMEYYHLLFQTGAVAQPHSGNPRRVGYSSLSASRAAWQAAESSPLFGQN